MSGYYAKNLGCFSPRLSLPLTGRETKAERWLMRVTKNGCKPRENFQRMKSSVYKQISREKKTIVYWRGAITNQREATLLHAILPFRIIKDLPLESDGLR